MAMKEVSVKNIVYHLRRMSEAEPWVANSIKLALIDSIRKSGNYLLVAARIEALRSNVDVKQLIIDLEKEKM